MHKLYQHLPPPPSSATYYNSSRFMPPMPPQPVHPAMTVNLPPPTYASHPAPPSHPSPAKPKRTAAEGKKAGFLFEHLARSPRFDNITRRPG